MFIADLHIHSKFSRATSDDMDVEHLAQWARLKGIKLLGTGDFTHPDWLKELKKKLSLENGLYKYGETYFLLTAEVCNIFPYKGKAKKIHNILFAPNISEAEKINEAFKKYGNLVVDGRPFLDLDCYSMVKIIKKISPSAQIIPAHIWTPHFSLFGANSGFDKIEDCFKDVTGEIFALETGLSSDPPMNRRLSALDRFNLISNSDAHSPAKIGREANALDCPLRYDEIIKTLKTGENFLYTIEFFPQEGKYHFNGHRNCGIRLSPEETMQKGKLCPLCLKPLTIGVMHRVLELADRKTEDIPDKFIPYKNSIPLEEIIADALKVGVQTQQVRNEYLSLVNKYGGEFQILLDLSAEFIREHFSAPIGERILAVREGKVSIKEGYDGVYGEIKVQVEQKDEGQLKLF
ncbi:MAG: endonuclease Q family protein [Candidatus Ratteibacteria bacterium]|nr:endonuclease Q family protein [Candidatus Ratteibacteria bacterium]